MALSYAYYGHAFEWSSSHGRIADRRLAGGPANRSLSRTGTALRREFHLSVLEQAFDRDDDAVFRDGGAGSPADPMGSWRPPTVSVALRIARVRQRSSIAVWRSVR
jgi:hypothetical protein